MADVHLTLAITCLFDPKNAEWRAEMRPVLYATDDDNVTESQNFQASDYLAASLPEVFSAMETIGVRIQRGVEETEERLLQGEELRTVADPVAEDRYERTVNLAHALALHVAGGDEQQASEWAHKLVTFIESEGETDVTPEGD